MNTIARPASSPHHEAARVPSHLSERLAEALRTHSPASPGIEAHLSAALSQAVNRPGHLVRAQLVYRASVQHGLSESAAEQLACAVEYFHLSSLLLDDLPCMDDAQTRRGLPCIHRTHGDATAILAALALINRAYALVGWVMAPQSADVRIRAQACLDACLGVGGIVGGQAADLRFAESSGSAREVSRIAASKTGSLFWLAAFFPALLAQPNLHELRLLKRLCIYWGLAYQTLDDLRDVYSNHHDAGKTTGRDFSLGRPNLALVLGVPTARRRLVRLVLLASQCASQLSASHDRWSYLEDFHIEFFLGEICRNETVGAGEAA